PLPRRRSRNRPESRQPQIQAALPVDGIRRRPRRQTLRRPPPRPHGKPLERIQTPLGSFATGLRHARLFALSAAKRSRAEGFTSSHSPLATRHFLLWFHYRSPIALREKLNYSESGLLRASLSRGPARRVRARTTPCWPGCDCSLTTEYSTERE